MLAWHLPHQLAAELVLVGVSAMVLLYSLLPWGKNQWLRTHGVILCGYYAVGGLVYDELEGWGLLDTTYFLTVTITTVGYGDFCPETPEGKLFTVVYCLVRLADQGDARAARLLLERAHHLPAVGGRRRALRPPRRLPRDGDAAGRAGRSPSGLEQESTVARPLGALLVLDS